MAGAKPTGTLTLTLLAIDFYPDR